MGAKIPEHLKTRQPTCKCDVCGFSFLSIQALRMHQACVHPRTSKRVAYRPKIEVIARRKLVSGKKTSKKGNMNVKLDKLPVEKPVSSTVSSVQDKPYNTRKAEFECPVCSRLFKVYFSAYKHIQSNHCINDNGEPVSPNSSDLVQPTRIELCSSCNKRVATDSPHDCSVRVDEVCKNYTCLGCEQSFVSPHMFKVHIPGLHCDEAESFTFPDFATYTEWKDDMESQTKIKYVKLSTKHCNDMYHCNHTLEDEKTTQFCPSSLSIQQTAAKEVRVTFFEEHFGHDFNPYKIPEKYKKYVTSMDDSEMENVAKSKDNVEVYGQFKQVMNDIIRSSEKIDVKDLRMLLGKALEMSSTLKKLNEHVQDGNKSITDDEITKLLDKPVRKRKMDIRESVAKRLRSESTSQNSDTETPVKEEVTPPVKEIKTYTNPKKIQPKEEVKKVEVQSPSSFSESYKNFVDASYKSVEKNNDSPAEKSKTKAKVETKKKEIVKTKVGQFKPLSPRGSNVLQVKPNILSREKRVHINESPKVGKLGPVKSSMSPKEKGQIKSILSKEPKVLKVDGTKETKTVHIKSEKSPNKYVDELCLPKIKPDFEYEIKEQENDCNILIIKI